MLIYEISGSPVDVTTNDEGTSNFNSKPPSGFESVAGNGCDSVNGHWGAGSGAGDGGSAGITLPLGTSLSQRPAGSVYLLAAARHTAGANYILCDGHAKYFLPTAVSTGYGTCASTDLQDFCNGNSAGYPTAAGVDTMGQNGFAITFSGQ